MSSDPNTTENAAAPTSPTTDIVDTAPVEKVEVGNNDADAGRCIMGGCCCFYTNKSFLLLKTTTSKQKHQ